jgi:hypothetical protein
MTTPWIQLRAGLRMAHTRWQRLTAAPERLRRRRRAQTLGDSSSVNLSAALAPAELTRDGFSLAQLDTSLTRRILDDWQALQAQRATRPTAAVVRTTGKMFFEELLSEEDLSRFPAFLATAINPAVLRTVTGAMGMVPHLESVDILASLPGAGKPSASQLWHYDVNDQRIIKLFIYLEDCGPENGPFTFIPAGPSQRVSSAVGHYVDDDRIAGHVPRAQWRTVEGGAGTGFFIDTGRCYHFGSRCSKRRVAFVATYSSGLKFMQRARLWQHVLQSPTLDPLQRAVCGIAA